MNRELHVQLPLSYPYCLDPPTQCLEIPGLHRFPSSSSFSFHTWVCLDYPQTQGKVTYSESAIFGLNSTPKRRRTLYRYVYVSVSVQMGTRAFPR